MTAPDRRGRALLVALAVLPWLGLLLARGEHGAASLIGGGLAVLAAMHGVGALVGWAADRRGSAWLRVGWGAAALIAAGGALMMLGGYGARGQRALLFLGVIAHSAELARGARAYAVALGEARGWRWPVAVAALAAVALLHALGHAGAVLDSPWDGEANALGQLRLLEATGHLGDAVGFARAQSLGGGLVLRALAGLSGARTMDALGMAALLALTAARLLALDGGGRREGALWAGLVGLVGMTFSRFPNDAALLWWPAALLVAGAFTVEREGDGEDDHRGAGGRAAASDGQPAGALATPSLRRCLPVILIAAALAVIDHALIPAALALGGVALWPHRRRRGARVAVAAGVTLGMALVAPYLVERSLARAELPQRALTLAVPSLGFSPLRLLLAALATALLAPLLRWLVEERRLAVLFAAALAGGLASPFSAARSHAGAYVLVAAMALLAFAVVRMAQAAESSSARASHPASALSLPLGAALLSLFLFVSLYEAQERGGGLRWSYRWTALSSAAGYVVSGPVSPPSPSQALRAVPEGATVALWIGQPERLDPRRHRLVDLRTPYLTALRAKRPQRFLAALDALAPDFLLYEEPIVDGGTLVGRACAIFGAALSSGCGDVFAPLAAAHRTVWRGEGLRVLALREGRAERP